MSVNDNIISAAISGHNFFILGQAGTGKSTVVKELYEILTSLGKKVKTAASTGLAATRLPNGTTVRHLFGLLDGRYPLEQLKKKISQDDSYRSVKNMILSTDSIIIDEVSMLSRKIFETVEGLCRFIRNNDSPFGGIQFILVGDFYQLRPVPNMIYGDSGEVLLETPNIRNLVPHKFILTEVHRQEEADLVHAVNELSHGYASPETKKLLESLTRPLAPGEPTARLFAQNYDVGKCNSDYLLDMEGEIITYEAKDEGDESFLSRCNGLETLHLKIGAPVILLVNLSSQLVNGLQGVVRKCERDSVTVYFKSLNREETISRYTFSVYSPDAQRDMAYRLQIPLKLAFALTVHKAQGMGFPRVVIDCRNMHNPGQIGVALGRGTHKDGLQVINYSDSLLKRHPHHISIFYADLGYFEAMLKKFWFATSYWEV